MKIATASFVICFSSVWAFAQHSVDTPAQTLQQREAEAYSLYTKHAYVEAAEVLEKLSNDPQIIAGVAG